jgi:glutaredoxin 2
MDLLRYSDTNLDICLKDKSRREINDILRQVYRYPNRIRICPCVTSSWVRETLRFLGAVYSNEPSHPQ